MAGAGADWVGVGALIDALIEREGGYVNHPSDPGGPTRWGITAAVARAYGYHGAISSLPRETAAEIYRKRYWTAPRFDAVGRIYPAVAAECFDTGVNMGVGVAARFLQRALNLLNMRGRDWGDIAVDGAVGAVTIDALRQLAARRGAAGGVVLCRCLNGFQLVRYAEIAEARASSEDFFLGWVANRIGDL